MVVARLGRGSASMMAAVIFLMAAVALGQPAAPAKGGVLIFTGPTGSCKEVEVLSQKMAKASYGKIKPTKCLAMPAPPPKRSH